MRKPFEATCNQCKTKFEANDEGDSSFYLLHCDKCGKENRVDRKEIDTLTQVEEFLGNCKCGGRFSFDASPRCPKCASDNYAMIRRDGRKTYTWSEGIVDAMAEHFEIVYGENSELVALIGKGDGQHFIVQFLFSKERLNNEEVLKATRKEINFYLVCLQEENPWNYAIYHCSTAANIYSGVHWNYYSEEFVSEQSNCLIREMSACRKCSQILGKRFVDPLTECQTVKPKPIFVHPENCLVMLIGQAPGISEYQAGKAFQGQAGKNIRKIFLEAGLPSESFDKQVYQTSVTKCFPGRKKVKRKDPRTGDLIYKEEDYVPSSAEVENCLPFLVRQINTAKPKIILPLGQFAAKECMRMMGKDTKLKLDELVGTKDKWDGMSVIFFPHTSGNARWLNDLKHRELLQKAKDILKTELELIR